MLAFHNDSAVKTKYLTRVEDHIKADALVRGLGWDNGRGCAIGCTLEAYDHSRYPIELGIPEWLARLEDTLFENMNEEKSRTWPKDFLVAIQVGVDLETAKGPFLIIVLERALSNFDHQEFPDVKLAIEGSIALWHRSDIGSEEWRSAAAESAVWSAESAARSAVWSAASAARSAVWSAASAARSAVWSAASAARSAVWSAESAESAAAFDFFADELLKILASIPASEKTA